MAITMITATISIPVTSTTAKHYAPVAGISDDLRHLWEFLEARLPHRRSSDRQSVAIEFTDTQAYEI